MAFSDLRLNRMDRYKLVILIALVVVSVILEAVVHNRLGIEVVYSHFFYIPVVLGTVWYGKRGILVGIFLAAVYTGDYLILTGTVQTDALIRALMFVLVGIIIGVVMDYLRREQEQVMNQMADAALSGSRQGGFRGNLDEWKAKLRTSVNVKRMREERDIQGLLLALKHRDPAVQYEAAEALGVLKDPLAVSPLVSALAGDRHSGVRWKAAEALARIGKPAVGPLIAALGNPDDDVRWKAAIALGEIGDTRAIPHLVTLLDDEDRFVQSRAAYALGQFGDAALSPLVTALGSPSPSVRRGSAQALGRTRSQDAIGPLLSLLNDTDEQARSAALEAILSLGEVAYRRVIELLHACAPCERALILHSMMEIPDRRLIEKFRPLLGEADEETRQVLESLLAQQKEPAG